MILEKQKSDLKSQKTAFEEIHLLFFLLFYQ